MIMKAKTRRRKVPARKRQRYYEFEFVFRGPDALDAGSPEADWERVGDALYEAGCDDALLGASCGLMYLAFTRKAPSLTQALASAIADVEKAGLDLEIANVTIESPAPPADGRKKRRAS
jgi:hypothetical protein